MAYCGDKEDTPRVKSAINYTVNAWNLPCQDSSHPHDSDGPGFRGNPGYPADYMATYSIMKGLQALGIETIGGFDWYKDICNILIAEQNQDGSWPKSLWDKTNSDPLPILSTEWAILTLEKAAPPPVDVW